MTTRQGLQPRARGTGTIGFEAVERYLARRAPATHIPQSVRTDVVMSVVIPAYLEDDLVETLASLRCCHPPSGSAEVIVVLNDSERDDETVGAFHRRQLEVLNAWMLENSDERIQFLAGYWPAMPARHAGAGLARRLGMDEALRRQASIGQLGIIVSLDADCRVESNYLTAVEQGFDADPAIGGATIHFEHPTAGSEPPELYDGICHYELFLRYYVNGLRYAGARFAHLTLGSALAVRAETYARVGGMNRRKAAEDFYFINKLVAHGDVGMIRGTTVVPSPRLSDRVPFGTGQAQRRWFSGAEREYLTYPVALFEGMRTLMDDIFPQLFDNDMDALDPLRWPSGVYESLVGLGLERQVAAIRGNVASRAQFIRHLHAWFDGLRALKVVKAMVNSDFDRVALGESARDLARLLEPLAHSDDGGARGVQIDCVSVRPLLQWYRDHNRGPLA